MNMDCRYNGQIGCEFIDTCPDRTRLGNEVDMDVLANLADQYRELCKTVSFTTCSKYIKLKDIFDRMERSKVN